MKKLIFSLIKGESGGDIYFENIKKCINGSLEVATDYFNNSYKFLPFLNRKSDCGDIYHCINGQVLWNLRKKKGYKIFSITHLMDELDYDDNMNFLQKTYYDLIFNRYLKKSLPYADKIISISKYSQMKLKEVLGFDSEVIYPCIDVEKFKPDNKKRDNKKIKIFFSGNSSKRKGFDLLPKIMNRLGDNFELSCTGLRDYDKENNFLKYLGRLDKEGLVNAYNDCDIFLFPSRLEGFGLSVAEAMSCGKPCVITNCSSLPEVMDSNGGFLCERDNVDEFVEKIKILANNKKLREKMGKYNRRRVVENFSFEALKDKYLELYKS
ncbi:MAG: glycosyltransferase family 4 protein [Nanoarchaeota archaeon]|nr:glycosyltransferase family 4 protein [Nanoarchaeota archaeon]